MEEVKLITLPPTVNHQVWAHYQSCVFSEQKQTGGIFKTL